MGQGSGAALQRLPLNAVVHGQSGHAQWRPHRRLASAHEPARSAPTPLPNTAHPLPLLQGPALRNALQRVPTNTGPCCVHPDIMHTCMQSSHVGSCASTQQKLGSVHAHNRAGPYCGPASACRVAPARAAISLPAATAAHTNTSLCHLLSQPVPPVNTSLCHLSTPACATCQHQPVPPVNPACATCQPSLCHLSTPACATCQHQPVPPVNTSLIAVCAPPTWQARPPACLRLPHLNSQPSSVSRATSVFSTCDASTSGARV